MRSWLKFILFFAAACLIVIVSLIGPIDKTPLYEHTFYKEMTAELDTLQFRKKQKQSLKSGWQKISITPDHPMPMAGYRIREKFESVHDSLFARIMVLQTNQQPIILISVDLLLFPPALKEKIVQQLGGSKKAFLYLSATHTHNGIGGWHDTAVGNFALGSYDARWIEDTSKKIVDAIRNIEKELQPTSIAYWESDAHEYAENRLANGASHDGILRGIRLIRSDSAKATLVTFSAHATSISKKSLALSGDYPAALTDTLSRSGEFAMFMAGMVGSHRLAGITETEFEMVAKAGQVLADKVTAATPINYSDSVSIVTKHIPITFGPSQLRISENWKLRDWIFRLLVNPLQGELTYLQMNDIVMIGTPCDFSGELFVNHIQQVAQRENKKVIITSFNGEYAGYITEDSHYESEHKEEVMTLNWVGPYYGAYFAEVINTLLSK